MITPAFGSVAGATEDVAAASISAFLIEVRDNAAGNGEALGYEPHVGEPQRSPELDADGRFGWTIAVNGQAVRILMPGIPAEALRSLSGDTPALRVNGQWAWWPTAAMWAVPLPGTP